MTPDEAQDLLDYHYWARDRLLAAVAPLAREQFQRDMGSSFPSIRDTLVHLLSAERVWRARWSGEPPVAMLPSDKFPDVPALDAAWREHEVKVRAALDRFGTELGRTIEYRTLSGQPQTSRFDDTFRQVINHGTHHRGQVVTMLRQLGAVPPKSLDLITYYRERARI